MKRYTEMKASLKLREEHHYQNQNPLVRVKLPVSILGLPFISSFTAGDPKDLSFNLHSNFLSGPSLKLSYTPNTTTTTTTTNSNHIPISLSLKSGVGLFGSPNNSPLVISAHFNLFSNPNPTFSLQIKPQFGDFFLSKTAVSSPLPNPNPNPKENGFPFNTDIPERPVVIMRNMYEGENALLSGVAVKAKTALPVAKCAAVKFCWGVNFPADSVEKLRLPYLTVDKISIERVGEVPGEGAKVPLKSDDKNKNTDLEVLKGMCFWMRKEVDELQAENNVMKESLEKMRTRSTKGNIKESNKNVGRKTVASAPYSENSSEFENWRSKKNSVDENGKSESKKFSGVKNTTTDVSEELKRAIQAASSNGV